MDARETVEFTYHQFNTRSKGELVFAASFCYRIDYKVSTTLIRALLRVRVRIILVSRTRFMNLIDEGNCIN